jgi:hypothetical protein
MYLNAVTDGANAALRARPGQLPAPPNVDTPSTAPATNIADPSAPIGVVVPPVATPDDPDAAPASAPPKVKTPTPSVAPAKGKDPEPNEDSSKSKEDSTGTTPTDGNAGIGSSKLGDSTSGSAT